VVSAGADVQSGKVVLSAKAAWPFAEGNQP
jgi:hypothetical protein